jgi:hypothetical protein
MRKFFDCLFGWLFGAFAMAVACIAGAMAVCILIMGLNLVSATFYQPECKYVIDQKVDVSGGVYRGKSGKIISGRFDRSPFGSQWLYYVDLGDYSKEFIEESELKAME